MIEKIEEYKKLSLDEIEARIEANNEELDKIWDEDDGSSYEAYKAKCEPFWDDNYYLWTAKTMIIPREKIHMRKSSEFEDACREPIGKYIEICKSGYLSGYDGFGEYATENEVSSLQALPRAVYDGYVRDDFDYVCWYNK